MDPDIIVFTSFFLTVTKEKAQNLARAAGYTVSQNVTIKTTILVAAGYKEYGEIMAYQTKNFLRAQQYIKYGYPIQIMGELEFLRLVKYPIPEENDTE